MAGKTIKQQAITKNTKSASKKPLKSSQGRSFTLEKTKAKTTTKYASLRRGSLAKTVSSLSSSTVLKKKMEVNSPKSSTPKISNEVISNILKTRTTAENSRHSLNLAKGRELVAGEFRRRGRPKKDLSEKEKPRTIRASDNFIRKAKELAEQEGYDGAWQTWLKDLANKRFSKFTNS